MLRFWVEFAGFHLFVCWSELLVAPVPVPQPQFLSEKIGFPWDVAAASWAPQQAVGAAGGSIGWELSHWGCLQSAEPWTCSPVCCQVQVWGCAIFPCCCGCFWDLLSLLCQPRVLRGLWRQWDAESLGTGHRDGDGSTVGRRGVSVILCLD